MKARLLQQLEAEIEAQGLKRDTPLYLRVYRERKVDLCKQMQQVESCWDCRAFDHCELVKAHLMDLNTPLKKPA